MGVQKFEATPAVVNGQVVWTLCYKNPNPDVCGNSNATYPDVTVPQNNGSEQFQFKIVNDNTGLNIQFAANNPLWVQANSKPTGPGLNGQIPPTSLGGQGTKTLTFVDLNSLPSPTNPSAVVLKYQLNFTDGQGNAVTSIDPDITNGGKTIYAYLNTTVFAVTAVVALALLFVWYRSRAAKTAAKEV